MGNYTGQALALVTEYAGQLHAVDFMQPKAVAAAAAIQGARGVIADDDIDLVHLVVCDQLHHYQEALIALPPNLSHVIRALEDDAESRGVILRPKAAWLCPKRHNQT